MYFPDGVVMNNAIIGGDATRLTGRNVYPVSLKQLRFVDPENGDYRLRPDSPLKKAGPGDLGANLDRQLVGRGR
jgi:hypothetical protein